MVEKHRVLIIAGPAASGKNELCNVVLPRIPELERVVTDTTRELRKEELAGKHYHPRTREEFMSGVDAGEYIEYAKVHSTQGREYWYGSRFGELKKIYERGHIPLYIVNVQGVDTLRQKLDTYSIFIRPSEPWRAVIMARMMKRGDKEHQIEERMISAEDEMKRCYDFDDWMINHEGKFEESCEEFFQRIQKAIRIIMRK